MEGSPRIKESLVAPNSHKIPFYKCIASHSTNSESQDHQNSCRGLRTKLKNKMRGSGGNISPNLELSLNCKPSHGDHTQYKKRALLCGVSYKKWRYKLKGTINDVKCMRELLIETFKFPKESIRVLTEEEPDPEFTPTRKNIQNALQWLVEGCKSGDSLVFYFSGHGLRQPEFSGDEQDGFDETICPVDFKKEGMILDNDINSTIVRPLVPGVTLHAIIDACHSGTILDLPYVYAYNSKYNGKWVDDIPPSGANKRTSGGLAICFSACKDHQMASDTSAFSGNEMAGAMTWSFISAVKGKPQMTYGKLLDYMYDAIEKANETGCFNGRLLQRMFRTKMYQDPQLSSSEAFDIYSKLFKL